MRCLVEVLVLSLVGPVALLHGQDAPSGNRRMAVVGDPRGSLLPRGPRGAFEGTLQNLGAIVRHAGRYHLFFNDLQGGWPPTATLIGYATSTDGVTWQPSSNEPLLRGTDVPYASGGIAVHSVVVTPQGTWVMYFDTPDVNVIGRATAPGPLGPWTPDSTPVLTPDGPASWDARGMTAPSVVWTGRGYAMYFGVLGAQSQTPNPAMAIGMATSADGITWQKHNDPATGGAFVESDPVLTHAEMGAWDGHKVESPHVVRVGGHWVMAYRSDDGHESWGQRTAYGLATSEDGVEWRRWQTGPVLSEDDVDEWATLWSATLITGDEDLMLYVETDGLPIRGTRVNLVLLPILSLGLEP